MLDSGAEKPGFKSQSRSCRVTVLGKLFTPTVSLARVTAGLAESNGSLPPGLTHVTFRLTAKHRDQLRNPTLGSQVRPPLSFYRLFLPFTAGTPTAVGHESSSWQIKGGRRIVHTPITRPLVGLLSTVQPTRSLASARLEQSHSCLLLVWGVSPLRR